jgi:hypothetical protein
VRDESRIYPPSPKTQDRCRPSGASRYRTGYVAERGEAKKNLPPAKKQAIGNSFQDNGGTTKNRRDILEHTGWTYSFFCCLS